MNLNKKIMIALLSTLLLPDSFVYAADPVKPTKEETTSSELLNDIPLNNPFGGSAASSNDPSNNSLNQSEDGLSGRILVGVVNGNNKKIAIFQNPNGSFVIVKEKNVLAPNLILKSVKSDFVIIVDSSKKDTEYQVFFNNLVKPIKDN